VANELTLVFSDLHQPSQAVLDEINKIIEINRSEQGPCNVVFLGDYFDDFGDTLGDTRRMATWLVESLKDPTRIHLIGNHDLAYFYPGRFTYCSGYDRGKNGVVLNLLEKHISEFKFYTWVGDVLLTHAGLSKKMLDEINIKARSKSSIDRILAREATVASDSLRNNKFHWFASVSYIRGGGNNVGGPCWCDYHEFIPIAGIRQIFGHTPRGPDWADSEHRNLLLDSHHGYPWAMIHVDGTVTINKIEIGQS
jgi:hypothetical protein